MSRWNDKFESHPFQPIWQNLKDSLKESYVDDESVSTDVVEIARLKKVVEFLDSMLKSVDPEMVPLSTWDNFHKQVEPCLQQIMIFNSNRNINHISQANIHADNLLTYLRPYMVLPKEAAASIKRASTIYSKTIEDYVKAFQVEAKDLLDEIGGLKENAIVLNASIESKKDKIDELDSILFGDDGSTGTRGKLSDLLIDSEEMYDSITELYKETLIGDEENLSTKKELIQAKDTILEQRDSIDDLMKSITGEISELEKFHTKIFGSYDEEKESREGGLSSDLEILRTNLINFEIKQNSRYKALNDEIESLIPGATSAGLASAYRSLRKSFAKPLRIYTNTFYAALGILFVSALIFVIDDIGWFYVKFVDVSNLQMFINNSIYKLTIFIPVVWLALFSSKRRSEAQRLQQEYAHKEALAKSYQSFKTQIEQLGIEDKVLIQQLIESAISAISYNASVTLDGKHGDNVPSQSILESLIDTYISKRNK